MVHTSIGVNNYFCTNDILWCHHKWRHTFWLHLLVPLPCQFSIFEDLLRWQPWIGLTFIVVLVLAKNTNQQRPTGLLVTPRSRLSLTNSWLLATNAPEKVTAGRPFWCPYRNVESLLHTHTNRKRQRTQHKIRFALCQTRWNKCHSSSIWKLFLI